MGRIDKFKNQRMSEIVISNEGYPMHIVEYNRAKDVTVEFLDEYKTKVHTDYRFFKQGIVKNPNRIGEYGERLGNECPIMENGKELKVYSTWRNIFTRIYPNDDIHKKVYKDIGIATEWLYYPNFYRWATNEENYLKWSNIGENWALDKDILSDPKNKIYSPQTCCLVPKYINSVVVRQG